MALENSKKDRNLKKKEEEIKRIKKINESLKKFNKGVSTKTFTSSYSKINKNKAGKRKTMGKKG